MFLCWTCYQFIFTCPEMPIWFLCRNCSYAGCSYRGVLLLLYYIVDLPGFCSYVGVVLIYRMFLQRKSTVCRYSFHVYRQAHCSFLSILDRLPTSAFLKTNSQFVLRKSISVVYTGFRADEGGGPGSNGRGTFFTLEK